MRRGLDTGASTRAARNSQAASETKFAPAVSGFLGAHFDGCGGGMVYPR